MKHRYAMSLAAAAALLVLASCELALGPRSEGTIVLNLGGGPSSRAFSDPPFRGLPVFSSVTVTVSGSGMPTASQTVPGTATSVTLQVPAGPARKVEVYAVPDWAATALQVPDPLPTLAKAYGGTAIVDVAGGQKANVSMDMDVVETKIVLPDSWGNSKIADTMGGPSNVVVGFPSISPDSDFEFDRYGRLYVTSADGMDRFRDFGGSDAEYNLEYANMRIAYDMKNERMYFLYDSEGFSVRYLDLREGLVYDVIAPPNVTIQGWDQNYGLAVDDDGFVYVGATYVPEAIAFNAIVKLAIGTPGAETADSQLAGYASHVALGLEQEDGYFLIVQDMRVQEGSLYIAAGEHGPEYINSTLHHGKIVQVRLSDMSKVREIGWSETTPIPNPSTQLYGPKRFLAIMPRKLIVADEGFIYVDVTRVEIDRVVEVDLESWSLSRIGLEGEVTFFATYAC